MCDEKIFIRRKRAEEIGARVRSCRCYPTGPSFINKITKACVAAVTSVTGLGVLLKMESASSGGHRTAVFDG